MNRRQRARKKRQAQAHPKSIELARATRLSLEEDLRRSDKYGVQKMAEQHGVEFTTKTTKKTLIERIVAAVKS